MWTIFLLAALVPASYAQVFCTGLGSFNPDPPFSGWPDPTCPGDSTLELTFTMYTSGSSIGQSFDRDTVPSNFNSGRDTLIIIHGWNNDGSTGWLADIKDAITSTETMNAIIVGWGGSGGSNNLNYWESASTTRTVGAELAEVVSNLISSGGGSASRFHCTGHSLGAHTCGHYGRRAAGNGQRPARVTGMDPAGPNFAINPDREVGLWTDCGDFVDVIHTDRSLGSTPEPGADSLTLGDVDFYPNDGQDQPGCSTDICGHGRAHQFFLSSIDNNCFVAEQECTNSGNLPGSCSSCSGCPTMGYRCSTLARGIYTLTTTSTSGTYC